jgi:hypothetical protein
MDLVVLEIGVGCIAWWPLAALLNWFGVNGFISFF